MTPHIRNATRNGCNAPQPQDERTWSRPTNSRTIATRINRATGHDLQTCRLATLPRTNLPTHTKSMYKRIAHQMCHVARWRSTGPVDLTQTLHCFNKCIRNGTKRVTPTIVSTIVSTTAPTLFLAIVTTIAFAIVSRLSPNTWATLGLGVRHGVDFFVVPGEIQGWAYPGVG